MSSNSILGTKLFLEAGADSKIFDSYGNTPARYAFYSGRFDCYDLLIKDNNFKHDLSLQKKIDSMKIHSKDNQDLISKMFNDYYEYEKKYKLNDLINFKNLELCFENCDYKNAQKLIAKLKNNKIELNSHETYKLIELSCKIRNIEFFKLVLELSRSANFHLGPFIGKYGLVSWFNEISNLGIDIFTKTKEIFEEKNIYDFCLLNDDKKMMKQLFKILDKITLTNEKDISELFCKALIHGKLNILKQFEKELNNPKYKDFQISIEYLSKNINITLKKLKFIINSFNKVNSKTLDIKSIVKYCRPNVFEYLLENKNIQENLELLNELKYLAIENKRFDNLYILIQKFPILSDNSVNINKINENLIEIEELLQPIKDQQLGIEEFMKKQLYQKLKSFNIGFLKLPINNTYLPHLIIKSKNLWAFECLKDIYNDLFFLDDESNTCFHYLKPNIDIGIISFEDLNIIKGY